MKATSSQFAPIAGHIRTHRLERIEALADLVARGIARVLQWTRMSA